MDPSRAFVDLANPHSWLLCADNLHAQARSLYENRGRGVMSRITYVDGTTHSRDHVNKSVFLLGGFALENAIKAFVVYEHPSWISNGALSTQLRSHKLTLLATQSTHLPRKVRSRRVLEQFEHGLESWARYPCALRANDLSEEREMGADLWRRYSLLMRAYARELRNLLAKGWQGPHGFYGKFEMEDGFLAMEQEYV